MNLRTSLIFLVAAACASPAPKKPGTQDVARFAVASGAEATTVKPGDVLPVTVRGTIEPGWQIYSLTQKAGGPTPLTFTVQPTPPFELDNAVTGPAPMVKRDPIFGIDTETYDAAPTFVVPIRVAASAATGPRTIRLDIRSQACSETVCLPAVTTSIDVPVIIAAR